MCGIIGGFSSAVPDPLQVLGTIIHRGPDSQVFFVDGKLFLGHTRLSIQGLSENGHQPIYSSVGNRTNSQNKNWIRCN
jgi:asparagine synthase (glutamine-hydrolysing)